MSASFETLPPELFRYILAYLSPEATAALAQTCRRMHTITRDDKIWRRHFAERYTYSSRTLQFSTEEYLICTALKSGELCDSATWQAHFVQRALQDKHIRSLLDEIIASRKHRIRNINLVATTYGLLAFDVLKRYFPPENTASTSSSLSSRNLTREHYALEVARLISRQMGVALLEDLKRHSETGNEGKALFNALFIIQCFHSHGILLPVTRLHDIGQSVRNDPLFATLTLTEKCQVLLAMMRKENFLPANGGPEYYDVDNSFLYCTFHGRPTLPLTLVAVFCALAEECGLIARPLGFPGEVMAHVQQESTPLIISVFEGKIMSLDELNVRLEDFLDEPLTHPLPITPLTELIIRSARNMINSISQHPTSSLNAHGLYAAVAVLKNLGTGALPFTFDSIMRVLKEHYPTDTQFLQMLSSSAAGNDDLQQIQEQDDNPPPIEPKRRTDSVPKYSIGQIFRHLQYDYWAVICGWDAVCMASPVWQIRMGISNLARQASQPFYHILANDSSRRYVAEDNIDVSAFASLASDEERCAILQKLCGAEGIGRQFERIDVVNNRFVPNQELREEYPDDYC